MHQDEYDGVPSCLKRGTVLGAVKAWPGNAGARGKPSQPANNRVGSDSVLRPLFDTESERLAARQHCLPEVIAMAR